MEHVADGAPEVETAKVIWQTPPYPDYNWTIRGDVDETFGEGFADRVLRRSEGVFGQLKAVAFGFSGLLGGVLSVAYSVVRSNPTRRIPEVRSSFAVMMVRPVIGAAIALPILFFLEAGLIVDDAHRLRAGEQRA